MNKTATNTADLELEAIKQMALEIALRINVLQGNSLLNGGVTPPVPVKRKWTKKDVTLLLSAMVAMLLVMIVVIKYNQPLILLAMVIAIYGREAFVKYKKYRQKKQTESKGEVVQ